MGSRTHIRAHLPHQKKNGTVAVCAAALLDIFLDRQPGSWIGSLDPHLYRPARAGLLGIQWNPLILKSEH